MDPLTSAYISYMMTTVMPQLDGWLIGLLPLFLGVALLIDFTNWGAGMVAG